MSTELICYVNGKRTVLPPGRGELTLLQYLREVGLTGTKLGCGEGGCGACTVVVSSWEDGKVAHKSVNACLCPLYSVEGMHVITVEGIGNVKSGLHPVQERLAKSHGSQCGFCTPGFVMSMYALLRSSTESPTEEDIEDALGGNLCRCTGYRPILDAFKVFAKTDPSAYTEEAIAASKGLAPDGTNGTASAAAGGGNICPSSGLPCDCKSNAVTNPPQNGCGKADCCKGTGGCGAAAPPARRPTSEPIFPPELKKRAPEALTIPGPVLTWHRPLTLEALLELKAAHPEARLVIGNTEVGIEQKFKWAGYKTLVATTHIPELTQITTTDAGVTIGASVPLNRVGRHFKFLIATRPPHETSTLRAVVSQLRWFAGNQIRNVAGLGGNIMTASPISDLNPLWMAARAVFVLKGKGTAERRVPASEFFISYRKVAAEPHEVLVAVEVPWTRPGEYVKEFKQAPRREDDIAIVNAGMRVLLAPGADGKMVVQEAAMAYGGVAAKSIMAPLTAAALVGKPWEQATVEAALKQLPTDVALSDTAPGGKIEYRKSLTASFLFKFFLHVSAQLEADAPGSAPALPAAHKSGAQEYHRPPASGVVFMHTADPASVVGQPYRHMAADLQVSGEAQYTDDVRLPANALYAAIVGSSRPHAKLLSVDPSAALAMPGVAGYFGAKDVPGHNQIGPIMKDEEAFATQEVVCVGQVIGVVVADTEAQARAAARAVAVEYEDLPAVFTCEQAVEQGSFYEAYKNKAECGDVEKALAECENVIEGVVKMSGQEHFYLEPQTCLIVPQENDEYLIIASTQAPAHNQETVCHVLGVPANKVVSKSKRLGGGFGGKESRACFLHAAIAVPAYHLKRPVRITLDRDEDMAITGARHPFMGKYRVGYAPDGTILAADIQLYANAGYSWDLSSGVVDRAIMHSDAVYRIPHMRVTGRMCRTNMASNTAYRGFGGPQGMFVMDSIMDRVAAAVGKPEWEVRRHNLYKEGDTTHFGQALEACRAEACWETAVKQADFEARVAAVEQYNSQNRWRKRGIAVLPTKFGIAFTAAWLNQGGALVHIYTDGTVLVTHGGVEMGQGLHTKMAMVAAHELGISMDAVYISETSTDKVPNASPTAASASADLYGGAVQDACVQLKERLAPICQKLGADASFAAVAKAAWLERVDLSAHGFYKTPEVDGFGGKRPFNYFCYGCAVTEVELDTLTGDFHLLRADVVMDVGNPINPAIDIGQVEGGFVQGVGWACIEELMWGDSEHPWIRPGNLFTKGPGTYKIPTANDIPIDFRTTLLQNAPNVRAVHSSKAVGEPPFHLGVSALFALKHAIYAARKDAGIEGWFPLDLPATPERLRMLCADKITAPYASPDIRPKISC